MVALKWPVVPDGGQVNVFKELPASTGGAGVFYRKMGGVGPMDKFKFLPTGNELFFIGFF